MFKKVSAVFSMLALLSLGVSQLLAGGYPELCEGQMCCPDTFQGGTFLAAVLLADGQTRCVYGTGSGVVYDYRDCGPTCY